MKRSTSERTRPLSLDQIRDHDAVIGLIRHDVRLGRPRHLIIAGPSGTGKTTMARAAVRAHACRDSVDGDACGKCEGCRAVDRGTGDIHEVDCPNGGSVEDISFLLDVEMANRPWELRYRICLLEEAEDLGRQAQNMFLVPLQEENPWLFIFTLINAEVLAKPLRDRCRVLRLELPTPERAMAYLESLCLSEEIAAEREALRLISLHSRGYRQLADDLELVADFCGGRTVTSHDVRERLLRDGSYGMLEFLNASAELRHEEALLTLDRMTIEPREMLAGMVDVLSHLTMKYASPRRARRADHPLSLLLPDAECERVVASFAGRACELGMTVPALLDAFLEHLLKIPADADRHRLEANLLRAHLLLAHAGPDRSANAAVAARRPASNAPEPGRNSRISGATNWRQQEGRGLCDTRGVHTIAPQALELHEALTFLTQEYGVTANAVLRAHPLKMGAGSDEEAAKLMGDLTRQLRTRLYRKMADAHGPAHDLHRITFHERTADGEFISTVLFHLPKELEEDCRGWLAQGFLANRSLPLDEGLLELDVQHPVGGGPMARQWALARPLWGGLDPALQVDGTPLLDILKVPRRLRREVGRVECRRQTFSQSISDKALMGAAVQRMEHLSPWRDRRRDQLFTGWEVHEHRDRVREKERRSTRVDELQRAFSGDGELEEAALRTALAKQQAAWAVHPHDRPRRWRGWWEDES